MASRPRVTVIIPTHNRLSLLAEAIDSVRNQSTTHWELIVVDDASDDGTPHWLNNALRDLRERTILLGERSERAVARNTGLDEAAGEFVLFLDDDDRLLPHALSYLVDPLLNDDDLAAAIGAVEFFDEGGVFRPPRALRKHVSKPWLDAIAGWVGLQGQTLFRRSELLDAGGYSTEIVRAGDQELWMRFGQRRVWHGPRRVLQVRSHPDRGSRKGDDIRPVEVAIREQFVASLQSAHREDGERAFAYWRERQAARDCYAAGDVRGFRHHTQLAVAADPRVAASPLLRAGRRRQLLKSRLGPRTIGTLRYLKSRLRWRLRDPG